VDELQVGRDPRGPVKPEPEHPPSSIITLNYDVGITVEARPGAVKQEAVPDSARQHRAPAGPLEHQAA
jgi:hypothetical protein